MPVERQYLNDATSIDIRPNGGSVQMAFTVDWADVPDVLDEILPPTTGGAIGAPELDPYLEIYRASNVRVSPLGSNPKLVNDIDLDPEDTIPRYETARIDVTYSNTESERPSDQDEATADGDPVPFLTHSWTTGSEVVEHKSTNARFPLGKKYDAETPISQVLGLVNHTIEWPRVVSPPFESIRALVGRVNSAALTFSTGIILPETLLFIGASLRRDYMSNGAKAWTLGYEFAERRIPIKYGQSVDPTYEYDPYAHPTYGNIPDFRYDSDAATKFGGWNHFFHVDSSSFARLYLDLPSSNVSVTWVESGGGGTQVVSLPPNTYGVYDDVTAPYKKGDFSLLFTQV